MPTKKNIELKVIELKMTEELKVIELKMTEELKVIELKMTELDLTILIDIVDEYSAMLGAGDNDLEGEKMVKAFDKMLKRNGYKRKYN